MCTTLKRRIGCAFLAFLLAFSLCFSAPRKAHAVVLPLIPVIGITAAQAAQLIVTAVVGYMAVDYSLYNSGIVGNYPSVAKAIDELVDNGFTSIKDLGQDAIQAIQADYIGSLTGDIETGQTVVNTTGMGTYTFIYEGEEVSVRTLEYSEADSYVETIKFMTGSGGSWNGFQDNYLMMQSAATGLKVYAYRCSAYQAGTGKAISYGSDVTTGLYPLVAKPGLAYTRNTSNALTLGYSYSGCNSSYSSISANGSGGRIVNGLSAETLRQGNWIVNTRYIKGMVGTDGAEATYTAPLTGYDAAAALEGGFSPNVAAQLSDGDYEGAASSVYEGGGTIVSTDMAAETPTYQDSVTGQTGNVNALTAEKQAFMDWLLEQVRTGAYTLEQAQAMINAWVAANAGTMVDSIGMTLEMALAWAGCLVLGFEGWNISTSLARLTNIFKALFPFCLISDFVTAIQGLSVQAAMDAQITIPLGGFNTGWGDWVIDLSPIYTVCGYVKGAITAAWSVLLFVITRKIFLKG